MGVGPGTGVSPSEPQRSHSVPPRSCWGHHLSRGPFRLLLAGATRPTNKSMAAPTFRQFLADEGLGLPEDGSTLGELAAEDADLHALLEAALLYLKRFGPPQQLEPRSSA